MNFWTATDIQSIMEPMMICIGIIHDFLRPTEGRYTASTMGDQSSLRE
jgi:hypothetical protein